MNWINNLINKLESLGFKCKREIIAFDSLGDIFSQNNDKTLIFVKYGIMMIGYEIDNDIIYMLDNIEKKQYSEIT